MYKLPKGTPIERYNQGYIEEFVTTRDSYYAEKELHAVPPYAGLDQRVIIYIPITDGYFALRLLKADLIHVQTS